MLTNTKLHLNYLSIPGESLAARYNWCQDPVSGRAPAVEKRWSRGFWKEEKSLLPAGNWTSIPRCAMSKLSQYTNPAITTCSREWPPQKCRSIGGVKHTSSFSMQIYVSCLLHVPAGLPEMFSTLNGGQVLGWSWWLRRKFPLCAVNLTPAFQHLAGAMTEIYT